MKNTTQRLRRKLTTWTVLTTLAPAVAGGPLNDTGIITFSDDTQNSLTSEPAGFPRQDARMGRDAAARAGTLTKIGAGAAGFDFSKIANNGSVLPASATLGSGATDWACTRDNVTGLIWEVKTADGGLRDQNWTYTWYDSVHNYGGNPGTASGTTNCKTAGRCDTEKFVADVKAAALCGYTDWRMPTVKELEGIADLSRIDPAIDTDYFPNTPSSWFWSGSPYAYTTSSAWFVYFDHGYANYGHRSNTNSVRLVRGGQ